MLAKKKPFLARRACRPKQVCAHFSFNPPRPPILLTVSLKCLAQLQQQLDGVAYAEISPRLCRAEGPACGQEKGSARCGIAGDSSRRQARRDSVAVANSAMPYIRLAEQKARLAAKKKALRAVESPATRLARRGSDAAAARMRRQAHILQSSIRLRAQHAFGTALSSAC